jgi:hypothetical protein
MILRCLPDIGLRDVSQVDFLFHRESSGDWRQRQRDTIQDRRLARAIAADEHVQMPVERYVLGLETTKIGQVDVLEYHGDSSSVRAGFRHETCQIIIYG